MRDTRDLRDPQALGEFLIKQRDQLNAHKEITGGSPPMSELYDFLEERVGWTLIPRYPKHDSIGMRTAEVYRQELAGREDKYAKRRLEELENE